MHQRVLSVTYNSINITLLTITKEIDAIEKSIKDESFFSIETQKKR
jgi:hypothetical protein